MGAKWQRVSGDELKKVEDQMNQGAALTPPTDANRNKKKPEIVYWTERVRVDEASAEETQSNAGDTHIKLEVSCTILPTRPTGEPSTNEGRTVAMRNRLNWDAWNKGDTNDGQYKMHRGTMGRMALLFRAAKFYEGGDIEPELWAHVFPDLGQSPLVGMEFDVEIKQAPNDEGKVFPEIAKVILPDDVNTPTEATPVRNGAVTL